MHHTINNANICNLNDLQYGGEVRQLLASITQKQVKYAERYYNGEKAKTFNYQSPSRLQL